jgi:hypothetical protein
MRWLLSVPLLAATLLGPVYAQDTPSPAPLPRAMQNAIDRIAKGAAATERPVIFRGAPPIQLSSPAPVCSVPLLGMHVDNPERFSIQTVAPPAIDSRMPRTTGPAPPCEGAPVTR